MASSGRKGAGGIFSVLLEEFTDLDDQEEQQNPAVSIPHCMSLAGPTCDLY